MSSKPKLLLVYPHDLKESKSGVNTRIGQIASCLKPHFEIHQLGELNFDSKWTVSQEGNEYVDQVFLHRFDRQGTFFSSIKQLIKKWLPLSKKTPSSSRHEDAAPVSPPLKKFPDFSFPSTFQFLDSILDKHSYQAVLVSYVFWGKLVAHPKLAGSKKILLIEDFQTAQLYERHESIYSLGNVFEMETAIISLFQAAICISNQERWLFSQFCKQTSFYFIPHFLPQTTLPIQENHTHDLLFVGSDNPFNIQAIRWFLENVWPSLPSTTKLLIVGKVTNYVSPRENVELVPFMESMEDAYFKSKMVICPMFAGTGMKIKVVEALSYGKPVVCTLRALDGFSDYHENGCLLCETENEFTQNILQLIENKDLYRSVSEKAAAYFKSNFSEEKISTQLLSIVANG